MVTQAMEAKNQFQMKVRKADPELKEDETRYCLAGTQYLDSTWRRIKAMLPRGLSVKKPGERALKAIFVRAQQWRLMTDTPPFLEWDPQKFNSIADHCANVSLLSLCCWR